MLSTPTLTEVEGRCVGNARLGLVDGQNRHARYAIGLFDSTVWDRGYGTEITRLWAWAQFAFVPHWDSACVDDGSGIVVKDEEILVIGNVVEVRDGRVIRD